MKKSILGLCCFIAAQVSAIEFEKQYENDEILVSKITLAPHEEIGEHRDEYSQLVTAIKGGSITRFESDGRTEEVHLPTGVTIFRAADPENTTHRSVNNSSEPMELLVIQLKKQKSRHDISMDIRIDCADGDEFKAFVGSIPKEDNLSLDRWKNGFVHEMTQLIRLVENGKFSFGSVVIGIDKTEEKTNGS